MAGWKNNATFYIYRYLTNNTDLGDTVWGEASELFHTAELPMEELANWLENKIRDDNPYTGLYADLVEAALQDVDWYDIADTLLRRIKDEERSNNGG